MLLWIIALVMASIVVPVTAEADQIPRQFLGVWMGQESGRQKCTRRDWQKRDASLMMIEPAKMSGKEWGCDLTSVRSSGDTTTAQLKCAGEGYLWDATQKLLVRETNAGRSLVVAEKVTNKIVDGPNKERMPSGLARRRTKRVGSSSARSSGAAAIRRSRHRSPSRQRSATR